MFQSSRLQRRGLSFSKSMAHKVYEKINGSYNEELQAWLTYLLYSFFSSSYIWLVVDVLLIYNNVLQKEYSYVNEMYTSFILHRMRFLFYESFYKLNKSIHLFILLVWN